MYSVPITVHSLQCTVCLVQCTVYSVQCAYCLLLCTVCSVQCVVCIVLCAVCSVKCAERCVQLSVCCVQCLTFWSVAFFWLPWRALIYGTVCTGTVHLALHQHHRQRVVQVLVATQSPSAVLFLLQQLGVLQIAGQMATAVLGVAVITSTWAVALWLYNGHIRDES